MTTLKRFGLVFIPLPTCTPMEDGLVKKLDNPSGSEADNPETHSLTTQDLGGLISLAMNKKGYPEPSQQDLVAIVSQGLGLSKQEVEAVVKEYVSQYPVVRRDNAIEATSANDALINRLCSGAISPELLLKPVEFLGAAFNSWPKSYAYISVTALVSAGAIMGGPFGIAAAGLMVAAAGVTKITAYVLWANGWILDQRIQIIDGRTDIGANEKDRLSRETLSKWLGQLSNDATPLIADEFYNYTKKEGIPLIEAAGYLSRVHIMARSIPTGPVICDHHVHHPDADALEWLVDKSLEASIESTKIYLSHVRDKNIQRASAIRILDDCGKHLTDHYYECVIQYELRKCVTWYGKRYSADSGDFKPATAIVNRAVKRLSQIYNPC